MKKRGSTSDFIAQRNRELLRCFRYVLETSRGVALRDMFGMAARMPASRFWVSEVRAAEVISRMLKGECQDPKQCEQKRRMYDEIFRRVVDWRRLNPGHPLSDAVFHAVNSPASEFYLTDASAKVIIYAARRSGKRERKDTDYGRN